MTLPKCKESVTKVQNEDHETGKEKKMIALMLAAGVGKRLYGDDLTQPPKALLRFDGKTLLQRHIEVLRGNGVDRLVMVVGYRKADIMAEVRQIGAEDYVQTIFNPRYRGGPIISLWAAREVMRQGDDVMFMDADVLYQPALLERLIHSPHESCFLLDREIELGEDPVRMCIRDGDLVEFGKKIEGDFDLVGEWTGFMRMSPRIAARIADATDDLIERGTLEVTYEEAMRAVLLSEPRGTFGYEDITGIPWIEIDFPSDLLRAKKIIMPQISAASGLEGDGEIEFEPVAERASGT